MPILAKENDLYPLDLFQKEDLGREEGMQWFALYTLSRREKELMRKLVPLNVAFYGPLIPKRNKSPGGRTRTSYLPLFTNYVFMYGNEESRHAALTTNCISKWIPVTNGLELTRDLKQFYELISMDVPLTPEGRLGEGQRVRIRNGKFKGFEGFVVRREGKTRLLVAVNFLQQGASMLLEECELEPL